MLSRLFLGAFSTAEHVVVANLEFTRLEVVELGMPLACTTVRFDDSWIANSVKTGRRVKIRAKLCLLVMLRNGVTVGGDRRFVIAICVPRGLAQLSAGTAATNDRLKSIAARLLMR